MFAMIAGLGMQELIIILVILLLLFGSTRLPQLARGMGKSIREFKKGVTDGEDDAELDPARREQLASGDAAAARTRADDVSAERVAPGDRR
ncbi:MAG TPA: twin-arginine translocase TatA/TatE family subunit [Pyrinomonadaceae bacterium]|nr:twin-arginine translocase TatA/TatE family subunit [Pyrinomonadaceae bacterium]